MRTLLSPSQSIGFSRTTRISSQPSSVIRVIRALVAEGAKVECVDLWNGLTAETPTTLEVDLASVSDAAFRFFENHRFVFRSHSG